MLIKYRKNNIFFKLKFTIGVSNLSEHPCCCTLFCVSGCFEFQKVFKFSWNLIKQRIENKIGKVFIFLSSLSVEISPKAQSFPPFLLLLGPARMEGRGPVCPPPPRPASLPLSSSTAERVPCPWVTTGWDPLVSRVFHLVPAPDSTRRSIRPRGFAVLACPAGRDPLK